MALVVKNPPANAGDKDSRVWSLGWADLLKEGTATHCSILAWRIPSTEEPGGLHRVAKSQTWLSDLVCMHAHMQSTSLCQKGQKSCCLSRIPPQVSPAAHQGWQQPDRAPREPVSQALSLFPPPSSRHPEAPLSGRLVPPPSAENILIQNYPSSQPPPGRACIPAAGRSSLGDGFGFHGSWVWEESFLHCIRASLCLVKQDDEPLEARAYVF